MADRRKPILFFLLLLVVAIPLWLVSGRLGVLSGLRIPTSDLALAFTPMIVAVGLTAVIEGWAAAGSLVKNAFDVISVRWDRWMARIMLIPPLIYLTAFALMHLLGSTAAAPVPNLARLVLLFILFIALAAGEEVGWSGYAFGAMQQRWGSLAASIVLAVPWWLGHLPSMAEVGATGADMAWWVLGALGLRIIMAWLYNRTGASLFAMILFHALLNLSRVEIFPAVGAHYLTAYQAAADVVIAGLAAAVLTSTRARLGFEAPASVPNS
jgi:membrane protease YdiL (CAAX protease family)